MASWSCLGEILLVFIYLAQFPANSKTSAAKYSKIAAINIAEVDPILLTVCILFLRSLWILPTGNWSPERTDRDFEVFLWEKYFPAFPLFPNFPFFAFLPIIWCVRVSFSFKLYLLFSWKFLFSDYWERFDDCFLTISKYIN